MGNETNLLNLPYLPLLQLSSYLDYDSLTNLQNTSGTLRSFINTHRQHIPVFWQIVLHNEGSNELVQDMKGTPFRQGSYEQITSYLNRHGHSSAVFLNVSSTSIKNRADFIECIKKISVTSEFVTISAEYSDVAEEVLKRVNGIEYLLVRTYGDGIARSPDYLLSKHISNIPRIEISQLDHLNPAVLKYLKAHLFEVKLMPHFPEIFVNLALKEFERGDRDIDNWSFDMEYSRVNQVPPCNISILFNGIKHLETVWRTDAPNDGHFGNRNRIHIRPSLRGLYKMFSDNGRILAITLFTGSLRLLSIESGLTFDAEHSILWDLIRNSSKYPY